MPKSRSKNPLPESVFIESMLDKTRQNQALAVVLFKKLFQELPVQMQQVEQALAAAEIPAALTIIHKLNGSLGFCGFKALQELCSRLEMALMQNNQTEIKPLFLQLKQEISVFQKLQEPILQRLKPHC